MSPSPRPVPAVRSTATPKLLSKSAMARTSARRGTLERLSFSDVSRQAAISFRAAFLAPLMGISPLRRAALRMRIRSIGLHWGRANGIARDFKEGQPGRLGGGTGDAGAGPD